ncbi:SocA family protein [Hymenobacter sp. BT664]|uniref:SocA family protein n=1 Tax=Hymenobacter montanus TaxID=2771359 RepID=A0A927GKG7_9BACT|nr:Panacea domain-containing protein [Hymenobacter montanus]MBD2769149.1 SocA family protein [Hymenobacter montanus]
MNGAFFDYEKAIQALLYVVTQLKTPGLHKSFKVLYFAEQEYLRSWGNTMLTDVFVKMTDGPVPSHTYNLIKAATRREHGKPLDEKMVRYAQERVSLKEHLIQPLSAPDLDYLAETEIDCLNNAISLYQDLSYGDVKQISHNSAWQSAELKKPLDPLRIAAAGGADEVALDYLRESLYNNSYSSL